MKTSIGRYNFTGFADRIDFNDKGEIEIIDYKTGASIIQPRHRNWQLGYYAIAARNSGLGKVRKVTLDMLKLDKPLEFVIDDLGNAVCGYMRFNINEIERELVDTAEHVEKAYKQGFKSCSLDKGCEFCNEHVYKN